LHGEAVAAGMVCASRLAERRGLLPTEVTTRQVELLSRFGLPTERRSAWEPDTLLAVMRRDKKNVGGRLRLILPTRLGHVTGFDDVPEALVREVL
jgi:3-dehydroquinate synthase